MSAEGKSLDEMRRKFLPKKKDEGGDDAVPGATADEKDSEAQLKDLIEGMGGQEGDRVVKTPNRAVDLSAMRESKVPGSRGKQRPRANYAIVPSTLGGVPTDAILQFGRHAGHSVSELASDPQEGRGYLEWMLTETFPAELRDIVEAWLNHTAPRSPSGKLKMRVVPLGHIGTQTP